MHTNTPPSPARRDAGAVLAALREELTRRTLDAFIVPHSDEHLCEYLPPSAERLAWVSGFTGSAGSAVITAKDAAIFVDGRYTLQAANQVDHALFQIHHLTHTPPTTWISRHLRPGDVLGYDPRLHTVAQVDAMGRACRDAGAHLCAQEDNPIDILWSERPPPPMAAMRVHPVRYAGCESADKRAQIAKILRTAGHDGAVLGAADSIAWLLNVRGGDLPYTPVTLAFAIIDDTGRVDLFVDSRKVPRAVAAHMGDDVRVRPQEDFARALGELGAQGKIIRTPHGVNAWIVDTLRAAGARPRSDDDPCLLPKAIKNECELDGIRAAHIRDGAALTRFLAWIKTAPPGGGIDEISAAEALAAFRRENALFQGLSFPTISASGPNGAIVHYAVDADSNAPLKTNSLYLVDSGGQYLDGTTDVTRTLAIGTPTAHMREHFTRVLKGHIALARAVFPEGTTGAQLDPLARRPLWEAGLDYDHGTGHGVGCFLGVHEGPQRIAKAANPVALKPGMILSNEPGYYLPGAYGIRIENLVSVIVRDDIERPEPHTPASSAPAERPRMLGFETLTLAPIDRELIEGGLLNDEEISWIDAYHRRVYEALAPHLDKSTREWLVLACAPLPSPGEPSNKNRS